MTDLQRTDNQLVDAEQIKSSVKTRWEAAEFLIEKNLLPTKRGGWKPEEVILIISAGEQLGMNPITAVNSIDLIEGRVSIQSRIIQGLLAQAGIAVRVIQDYEPIFEEKKVPIKEDGKVKMEDGKVQYYLDDDGSPIIKKNEIDRVTTIEIIRDYGGNIGVVKNQLSFYLSDARQMGLYPTKTNWGRMPQHHSGHVKPGEVA